MNIFKTFIETIYFHVSYLSNQDPFERHEERGYYDITVPLGLISASIAVYNGVIVDVFFSVFGLHPFILFSSIFFIILSFWMYNHFDLERRSSIVSSNLYIYKNKTITKYIVYAFLAISFLIFIVYLEYNRVEINSFDKKFGIEYLINSIKT